MYARLPLGRNTGPTTEPLDCYGRSRPSPPAVFYLSVGLVAGSIIALQIGIMRVFSVGSWAHFLSLVVSLAVPGFLG